MITINSACEQCAQVAAKILKQRFPRGANWGITCGSGLTNAIPLENSETILLRNITGFEGIQNYQIEGQTRTLTYGTIPGTLQNAFVLGSRVHGNEDNDPHLLDMARLQMEMLLHYNRKMRFILTCAAGRLPLKWWERARGLSLKHKIRVGDVIIVDGIVGLTDNTVLKAGEFVSADDAIDPTLRHVAYQAGTRERRRFAFIDGYAMIKGPGVEGRNYQKRMIARMTRCAGVGMSLKLEFEIIALYEGKALALAVITNDEIEKHDHSGVVQSSVQISETINLGGYIVKIIKRAGESVHGGNKPFLRMVHP